MTIILLELTNPVKHLLMSPMGLCLATTYDPYEAEQWEQDYPECKVTRIRSV